MKLGGEEVKMPYTKKVLAAFKSYAFLLFLPILSGCGSGGGGLAALGLGSLFGGGVSGGLALLGGGAGTIAHTHNPEPASMFLLGSGVAAMSFLKKKASKKNLN
jgi:hypothetical protein